MQDETRTYLISSHKNFSHFQSVRYNIAMCNNVSYNETISWTRTSSTITYFNKIISYL